MQPMDAEAVAAFLARLLPAGERRTSQEIEGVRFLVGDVEYAGGYGKAGLPCGPFSEIARQNSRAVEETCGRKGWFFPPENRAVQAERFSGPIFRIFRFRLTDFHHLSGIDAMFVGHFFLQK